MHAKKLPVPHRELHDFVNEYFMYATPSRAGKNDYSSGDLLQHMAGRPGAFRD
jgi:hypothetical protein